MPQRPLRTTPIRRCRRALLAVSLFAGLTAGGCRQSPLTAQSERDLRDAIARSMQRELTEAERFPGTLTLTPEFGLEELKIKPELMPQLESMAGPDAYDRTTLPMNKDLLGQDSAVALVPLDNALKSAATYNLEIQFQRYAPSIAETQVIAAQAAFDWSLFGRSNWANNDEPRVGNFSPPSADQRQTFQNQFGLRRNLPTGGQFTIQQDLDAANVETVDGGSQVATDPDPQAEAAFTLQLDQPLLRGFGSDVAYAQTRLAINAERDQVAQLKGRLIRTITEAEQAYWQLYQAEWDLLILHRLLERGIATRDKIEVRQIFDAAPDQIANANAEVQGRLGLVMAARDALRRASDDLKRQMNDPDLTVGSETLVRARDNPIDAPIEFSLLDSMLSGVRRRPEVQQAIISIDDTSIRQVVADNARLPQLDMRLQARWSGLDDDFGEAFEDQADFVSYLVGLVFEFPLGNRRAEAQYLQRRLERQQAVIAYANTIQSVVKEVKDELRRVVTNYQLLEQARLFRLAQTENLRAFEVKLELLQGFTSELLDLWLQRQESVARAEQAEVGALINYNIAIARLHAAMGTALDRNRIDFVVPDGPIARGGR